MFSSVPPGSGCYDLLASFIEHLYVFNFVFETGKLKCSRSN